MVGHLVIAGLEALRNYILTYTLTCLVPAFLLAGAMVTFINRDAVLDYLGEKADKLRAYALASGSSFFIAACSCTVIPVASGLYYSGAGISVVAIVLWVAPAANILALVYTGNVLGTGFALARMISALTIAFALGGIMHAFFGKERAHKTPIPISRPRSKIISIKDFALLVLILLSLLLPNYIIQESAEAFKILMWGILTLGIGLYAYRFVPKRRIKYWLKETWWFVKIIFPLLILGVFVVGVVGAILPEVWIKTWLSGNGLLACFLSTLLGAANYFATMTEAPFVDTLMKLGMGRGPALSMLLIGSGVSLPNWLAIGRVFGFKKALVYVPAIIVLSTLAGWIFGNLIG